MWNLDLQFMPRLLSILVSAACISAPTIAVAAPLSPLAEHVLKPKDSFNECDKCPEMVVVPAGRFIMGSAANEKNRDNNEGPAHIVKIENQFAVGRFPITVDQFAAFVSETHYDAGAKCLSFDYGIGKWVDRPGLSWRNPGFSQDGNHPAVCLNWNDAKAYVDWLARKTGKDYRLLSEAEWEYARVAEPNRDASLDTRSATMKKIFAVTAMEPILAGEVLPGALGQSRRAMTATPSRHQLAPLKQTASVYSTCKVMLGSGPRTAIAIATRISIRHWMARLG